MSDPIYVTDQLIADDIDAYTLFYRDLATNTFLPVWDVPNYDNQGSGMQTRPNPNDNTERFTFLGGPVTTDALQFRAASGDGSYSVCEIQVFAVPAPGAASVIGGALLMASRRRR